MAQRIDIDEEGNKRYYNDQYKLHREDGPAIERANGLKFWYIDGFRHRLDGPAVESANGYKEWWINDIKLTKKRFNKLNKSSLFLLITKPYKYSV